ncbi:hypothetical protein CVM73_20390 [Bradyrhizobium forestalis]|uniref:Uncharacterized protein n=1 Tax=Bradyrhizobium forestalis TaxID=1419263 RepID=A0A2M8R6V1_9BRAD|nr:hypothetical protein [Bradyrhizobium forestalis]PJG53537.1 hypothetical protein CVM73_20390 [Bradyrhizobium forestalis]
MTVGFERWLQRRHDPGRRSYRSRIANDAIAPLCEQFNLFRGALAAAAPQKWHHHMIIEPTYCAGDAVRMRRTTETQ